MGAIRDRIKDLLSDEGQNNGAVAKVRSLAVLEAWKNRADPKTPHAFGGLNIERIRSIDGGSGVEVFLSADTVGETHYRIFNPPVLVPDGSGDVTIGKRKYREDPLACIVGVIQGVRGGGH